MKVGRCYHFIAFHEAFGENLLLQQSAFAVWSAVRNLGN
jgi:hypothetical protein